MNKLREKFIPYTLGNKLDVSRSGEHNAKLCEQITDDFSVEFARWINKSLIANTLIEVGCNYGELLEHFKTNIYGK